jgi:hypothetical protein
MATRKYGSIPDGIHVKKLSYDHAISYNIVNIQNLHLMLYELYTKIYFHNCFVSFSWCTHFRWTRLVRVSYFSPSLRNGGFKEGIYNFISIYQIFVVRYNLILIYITLILF